MKFSALLIATVLATASAFTTPLAATRSFTLRSTEETTAVIDNVVGSEAVVEPPAPVLPQVSPSMKVDSFGRPPPTPKF